MVEKSLLSALLIPAGSGALPPPVPPSPSGTIGGRGEVCASRLASSRPSVAAHGPCFPVPSAPLRYAPPPPPAGTDAVPQTDHGSALWS